MLYFVVGCVSFFSALTPSNPLLSPPTPTNITVHYYVVTLFLWTYTSILSSSGTEIEFVNSTQTRTKIDAGSRYAGWAYTSALSLIVSFTIGGLLKMTPGVGKLL